MGYKINKAKFLKGIAGSAGIRSVIAKRIGVSRKALWEYLKKNEWARIALESEEELISDIAETNLFKCIRNGDKWALAFYLKTKGRERGYVEKREVEHSGFDCVINIVNPYGVKKK